MHRAVKIELNGLNVRSGNGAASWDSTVSDLVTLRSSVMFVGVVTLGLFGKRCCTG